MKQFKNIVLNKQITEVNRISYRQDINTLRALSVLAVVGYHLEIYLFKGGWLGVDIFFLISGFLISNIILSDLVIDNFSFKNFIEKRYRRIVPPLLVTILISLPFSYFLLSPKAMIEFIRSAMSSLLLYSNIFFSNLDFYNAEPTKFMPLLHSWSLSIEEQFYVVFPILLFLVFKYFRKYLFTIFTLVTIYSIFLNISTFDNSKFYFLQFRAWEFVLGLLVMLFSKHVNLKSILLKASGYIFIFFSIFFFDDNWISDIEPKLIALAGTSLILISRSTINTSHNFKIIDIIGKSSYSMYLFHQPLFVFYEIYNFKKISTVSLLEKVVLLLLLICLSNFSFRNIEQFSRKIRLVHLNICVITSYLLIFIFCYFGLNSNGFSNRIVLPENLVNNSINLYETLTQKVDQVEVKCDTVTRDNYGLNFLDVCKFNPNSEKHLVLFSDSTGNNLAPVIKRSIDPTIGFSAFYGGRSLRCSLFDSKNEGCNGNEFKNFESFIKNNPNSVYIFSIGGWRYFKSDFNPNNINYFIDLIEENEGSSLLIYPPPYTIKPPFDTAYGLKAYSEGFIVYPDNVGFILQDWKEIKLKIDTKVSDLQFDKVIDFSELFCDSYVIGYCLSTFEGEIFYLDSSHLSKKGSELAVNYFLKDIYSLLNEK